MEDIIYALIPIFGIFAFAAIVIFRPLTKRLADILELQQRERAARRVEEGEHEQLRSFISSLERRMELLEQRLDFTESLVASGERKSLAAGGAAASGDRA